METTGMEIHGNGNTRGWRYTRMEIRGYGDTQGNTWGAKRPSVACNQSSLQTGKETRHNRKMLAVPYSVV